MTCQKFPDGSGRCRGERTSLRELRPKATTSEQPMATQLPRLFLARHGDTPWTDARRKTGRTDLDLNARGEERAREIGARLHAFTFKNVFTSPLKRASKTCELAGYSGVAAVDPNLAEWDYGDFEGKTTAEILGEFPDWELFRDGCPGGESPAEVAARCDRFIQRLRDIEGDVLAFSSGHLIRMM